jgi:hypothetical protein
MRKTLLEKIAFLKDQTDKNSGKSDRNILFIFRLVCQCDANQFKEMSILQVFFMRSAILTEYNEKHINTGTNNSIIF